MAETDNSQNESTFLTPKRSSNGGVCVWLHLQSLHLHHELTVVLLPHLLLEELREALLQHQTHVVPLGHADKNRGE